MSARPFPRPLSTLFVQYITPTLTIGSWEQNSDIFHAELPVIAESRWPLIVDLGCECGAPEHPEQTHEEALAAEIAGAMPGCTCPGYCGNDGEPAHDGFCDLSPWPEPCTCGDGCLAFTGCRMLS